MYRKGTRVRHEDEVGTIVDDAGTTDQGQMYEVEMENGRVETLPESKLRYVPPSTERTIHDEVRDAYRSSLAAKGIPMAKLDEIEADLDEDEPWMGNP